MKLSGDVKGGEDNDTAVQSIAEMEYIENNTSLTGNVLIIVLL